MRLITVPVLPGELCTAPSSLTNLTTGGTFTNIFSSNFRDHTIIDNHDGTITITVFGSGWLTLR